MTSMDRGEGNISEELQYSIYLFVCLFMINIKL